MKKGRLYLIPTLLGDVNSACCIPSGVKEIVQELDEFIVEKEKTARRYLKQLETRNAMQHLILHPLHKHTTPEEYSSYLDAAEKGKDIGLISEAGCPGVADPGAEIVRLAHQKNIRVIPLTGPSSILLALMASGLNGQHFIFHGYLPREQNQRISKIRALENKAASNNQTQIFIETPYRNMNMLKDIVRTCKSETLLCIAVNLTLPNEMVKTRSVSEWKNQLPDIHKKPAVFLIGT